MQIPTVCCCLGLYKQRDGLTPEEIAGCSGEDGLPRFGSAVAVQGKVNDNQKNNIPPPTPGLYVLWNERTETNFIYPWRCDIA